MEQEGGLGCDHGRALDEDHLAGAHREIAAGAAVDAEAGQARAPAQAAHRPAQILEQQPAQREQHAGVVGDPVGLELVEVELAIDLGHRDRVVAAVVAERALVIELLELAAARELGHLGVEVAADEARDRDDHHAPQRDVDPGPEPRRRVERDEHRADGAGHQVEVEPHRVRRQPAEHAEAPEHRIDRGDDHERGADQAALHRQLVAGAEVDLVDQQADRDAGVLLRVRQLIELIGPGRLVGAEQDLDQDRAPGQQADHPQQQRRVATAADLGLAAGADVDAVDERLAGQDLLAIDLDLLIEAGAGRRRRRRRALVEQIVGRQLDQRAGRARRDAGLIAVGRAVVALVGDAARTGDAAGAGPERERGLAVEPLLEAGDHARALVVDVDHVDRAVRAALRAGRAAGAGRLVDDDLALDRVVLDRVVRARIDAALIGAGPAGVDEVEHAELVATQRQPARAVALLARDLALLAVDAAIELADAHGLARHRDALADEEVEDLLLDAGDVDQAPARLLDRAPEAGLEERERDRDVGDEPLGHADDDPGRGGVERDRRAAGVHHRHAVEDVALGEHRHVLARGPGQRRRLDQRLGLALLGVHRLPAHAVVLALGQGVGLEHASGDLTVGDVDDRRRGRGARVHRVGEDDVALDHAPDQVAALQRADQGVVGHAVEERQAAEVRVAGPEVGW